MWTNLGSKYRFKPNIVKCYHLVYTYYDIMGRELRKMLGSSTYFYIFIVETNKV